MCDPIGRRQPHQPGGVRGPRGRDFLCLRPEGRHHGLRRREGPQGGAVGPRLQEKGRDGGEGDKDGACFFLGGLWGV